MAESLSVESPAALLDSVGVSLGPTPPLELSADSVREYRAATGDPSAEPVPPFLLLSLVNHFLPQLVTVRSFSMGVNVGLGSVRFPGAASSGDVRLVATGEILDAVEIRDAVQVVVKVRLLAEGENGNDDVIVCEADTISRFTP